MNQLASLLAALSPQQELLNAFSAFDDDDSGQIDVAELKSALMTTLPDPGEQRLAERDIDRALEGYTGRRILGRNATGISGVKGINTPSAKRTGGDVFRYQEFVANLTGGPPVMSGAEQVSVGGGLTRFDSLFLCVQLQTSLPPGAVLTCPLELRASTNPTFCSIKTT